ncbi:DUF7009 family protein [Mucilaginibacter defluvii]|uniref:Uncharacterized protein n=1 Tax=Mucilaginibacter defluvii TaxID=1196019 RepID=A0ABP9FSZ4_9SPHI
MKIRIKGNSIRYRLTRSEVERFCSRGYIEEVVDFGQRQLIYALQQTPAAGLSTTFDGNKIVIHMSAQMAAEWINTERVGFEDRNPSMYLLVEKDFVCIDNSIEDQSDNYPNPLMQTIEK